MSSATLHVGPWWKVPVHRQRNSADDGCWHVPPFMHGELLHGGASVPQVTPT